jgi:ribosomal protein S18 acetylase RimI-like enzyme
MAAPKPPVTIRTPRTLTDWAIARRLMAEYQSGIGLPLDFEGFPQEVQQLNEVYSPPKGAFFLAFRGSRTAGCAGLRPLSDDVGEIKRVFVRSEDREEGIGETLVLRVIAEAERRGYQSVRLDTLPTMTEALRLYRRLGFREIEPYRFNPVSDCHYFELTLRSGKKPARRARASPRRKAPSGNPE